MLKKLLKRFCAALTMFLLVIVAFVSSSIPTSELAQAATVENSLDNTSVESDLGEDFNWMLYPENKLRKFELLQFVEYCYTDDVSEKGNYGLYLYIYNPALLRFSASNNVVNMAVAYDENGTPIEYSNVPLRLCGYSHGDYAFRVYKFRISLPASVYVNAKTSNEKNGYRQYDISSIQLRVVGETISHDNTVARSFQCSGYAKGYDETSLRESTYACAWDDLETVELDVRSTYYRPAGSNGVNSFTQDTLHSVYFAVPNSIVEKYDRLWRVNGSYVKTMTDLMYLTGRKDIYDAMLEYIGVSGFQFGNNGLLYGFAGRDSSNQWIYTYNAASSEGSKIDQLDYIFYSGSSSDSADDYVLTDEEMLHWMASYSDLYAEDDDELFLVDGQPFRNYSRELFVQSSATTTKFDIVAEDTYSLLDEKVESNFWDKLWHTGDYSIVSSVPFKGIEAIRRVTSDDISLDRALMCDELYISQSDYTEFIEFYTEQTLLDKTVYLFRYDVSPYIAMETVQGKRDTGSPLVSGFGDSDTNGRLFQQYMYFDFDIIFLEYEKDGKYTVIPVSSDPIDVIADATGAIHTESDAPDWWKILLGLLVLVVIVFAVITWGPRLLISFFKMIGKGISTFFRKIGQALKRLFRRRR